MIPVIVMYIYLEMLLQKAKMSSNKTCPHIEQNCNPIKGGLIHFNGLSFIYLRLFYA